MKRFLWVFLVLAVLVLAPVGYVYHWLTSPIPLSEPKTVLIKKGSGSQGIAAALKDEGVIEYPMLWLATAELKGARTQLKPGEYALRPEMSPLNVMEFLREGRVVIHKLTMPEGKSVREAREALMAIALLEGDVPSDIEEGSLLPETYYFVYGDTREAVVKRMQGAMEQTLDELWAKRQEGLPLKTKEEAVVLASIVEKETGVDGERGKVAAVYINRLRIGMPLQADPTTQYGLEVESGKPLGRMLTLKDLESKTPYNTYVINGLPPGPIANPGREALEATLNPPKTEDLFFVATGRGGHYFAKTGKEHAANVAKYRATQR
jgi:UPF0755 protein